MKAQYNSAARGDEKSRSSARLHSSANIRQPQLASGQPIPAVRAQNEFTLEEHLLVQNEIEERSHRFWRANGYIPNRTLNNWLKAEAEVLAWFVKSRMQRHSESASGKTQQVARGKSTLLPSIPGQLPALSNLDSTTVFQHNL